MRNTLPPPFAEIQEKRNRYNPGMQSWKQKCIYRFPEIFKGDRAKCYTPLWVSFGPYHHGQGHLHQAEGHKERALFHMWPADPPAKDLWKSLQSEERELRDYYDDLTPGLHSDTFLRMMLLDGCFMLEIMRAYHRMMNRKTPPAAAGSSTYAETDPIFSNDSMFYVIPIIKNDMLMLENKIPLRVLKKLVEAERRYLNYSESYVVELVVDFLSEDVVHNGADRTSLIESCKDARHVLDVFRKMLLFDNCSGHPENNSGRSVGTRTERSNSSRSMLNQNINHNSLQNDPPRHNNYENGTRLHRPATRLREAGVKFRQSGSNFLGSLSFKQRDLFLPLMVVDDFIEARTLNLMAFERMHVEIPNKVSSYFAFMDRLIDTAKDVELLQEKGILQNMLGSDEEVANLFNRLCSGVAVGRETFTDDVEQKLVQYSSRPLNKWLASLRPHNYLNSPWTIVSIVAAFVLLVLTLIQTICSVKSTFYAKPNDTKFN